MIASRCVRGGAKAIVFDAYGTLFDVTAATRAGRLHLGEQYESVGEVWRAKQLEYSWLRSLATGMPRADFYRLTRDALKFSLRTHDLELATPGQRRILEDELMANFLTLPVIGDVVDGLSAVREARPDLPLAILSNGSPLMLDAHLNFNGELEGMFKAVISADGAQRDVDGGGGAVFKPHRAVYALASDHFAVKPPDVLFVSSNGWDIAGAAAYGFDCVWLNRGGVVADELPYPPPVLTADELNLPEVDQPKGAPRVIQSMAELLGVVADNEGGAGRGGAAIAEDDEDEDDEDEWRR